MPLTIIVVVERAVMVAAVGDHLADAPAKAVVMDARHHRADLRFFIAVIVGPGAAHAHQTSPRIVIVAILAMYIISRDIQSRASRVASDAGGGELVGVLVGIRSLPRDCHYSVAAHFSRPLRGLAPGRRTLFHGLAPRGYSQLPSARARIGSCRQDECAPTACLPAASCRVVFQCGQSRNRCAGKKLPALRADHPSFTAVP